ncbi:hypothetical protein [Methanoregula sp.]|uniref:hypothetical protein n=1 Tax=Methanoregula sp. TaxID=2052170 RepID=UPI003564D394
MNWNVITGIIILGIILGLCILVPPYMKQNGDPKMTNNKSQPHVSPSLEAPHVPDEWVIASFGLDEKNPGRTVFLKNPALMDVFINASKADTGSDKYPKGLVLGFAKDRDGSIVVLMNPNERVNQTVVDEVYSNISALGRTFNITSVPCKFIRMDIVDVEVLKDTTP